MIVIIHTIFDISIFYSDKKASTKLRGFVL
jgi:hypothetical protein